MRRALSFHVPVYEFTDKSCIGYMSDGDLAGVEAFTDKAVVDPLALLVVQALNEAGFECWLLRRDAEKRQITVDASKGSIGTWADQTKVVVTVPMMSMRFILLWPHRFP